jgi:hypothetical protein
VRYRIAASEFRRGELLKAYELAEAMIKDFEAKEGKEGAITYYLVKVQTLVAKTLNKMKDFTKAEDVCDDIVTLCAVPEGPEDSLERVQIHHKFALKALYMKAKNMQSQMEFRAAKDLLENQAKPILKKLIQRFGPEQTLEQKEANQAKDLLENRYSFTYRKRYALYLKKFAFYD